MLSVGINLTPLLGQREKPRTGFCCELTLLAVRPWVPAFTSSHLWNQEPGQTSFEFSTSKSLLRSKAPALLCERKSTSRMEQILNSCRRALDSTVLGHALDSTVLGAAEPGDPQGKLPCSLSAHLSYFRGLFDLQQGDLVPTSHSFLLDSGDSGCLQEHPGNVKCTHEILSKKTLGFQGKVLTIQDVLCFCTCVYIQGLTIQCNSCLYFISINIPPSCFRQSSIYVYISTEMSTLKKV